MSQSFASSARPLSVLTQAGVMYPDPVMSEEEIQHNYMADAVEAVMEKDVKRKLAITALCFSIVGSVVILFTFIVSGVLAADAISTIKANATSIPAYANAVKTSNSIQTFILCGVGAGALLNLAAWIMALVALMQSYIKKFPKIVFIVVWVMPAVIAGIGYAIYSVMVGLA